MNLNSPAQMVMNDIATRHPPSVGYDFDFNKQSAAEALDYGDDLRSLQQQCLTAEEFSGFLARMGIETSKALLLMELSNRLGFIGAQVCELPCIRPVHLLELLALTDYEIRRLKAGQEVKGMTLAMVSILRPMTIRSLINPEKPDPYQLSMGEEILISHYRLCSKKSKRAIWRAARLMARGAA